MYGYHRELAPSDGSPYEKRVDAKGRVLSDKCIADEVPFEELPEGWAWARLETVYNFIDYRGKTPHKSPSGVRLMTASNIRQGYIDYTREEYISEDEYATRLSRGETHRGDLLFTTEAPMGYCAICEMKRCSCGQRVITLQNYGTVGPDNALFCRIILSPLFQVQIKEHATGTTAKGIKAAVLKELFLPIPPLAEQRRIVERMNELMPIVEEYGGLEDAREALDAALPSRLRKSVLQLAVQGGLVPQDPADEPAGALLERIRGQRRKLIAEKKMKAPKGGESIIFAGSDGRRYEKKLDAKGRESEPVCIEDEVPYEIPEGWEWARLGSLCDFGKCRNIEYESVAVGTWNLDLEDIEKESGTILRKKRKTAGESGSTKHIFSAGMVLYSKLRPYLNKVVAADEGGVCSSEILPLDFGQLNSEYAQLALMEPGFVEYAKECSYGVKMPRLGTEDGKQWLVAIPPLPEQHRIVAAFETFTMNAF